jgi:hypothetical protein
MANLTYMAGRKKYRGRPQGMLWSDNPGTVTQVEGKTYYIPIGNEANSFDGFNSSEDFLILSDDNREAIAFKNNRIERRQRMINGRMRSYHIADKLTIDTSWTNLPSRSHSDVALFDPSGKTLLRNKGERSLGDEVENETESKWTTKQSQEFTTDGGAGGAEMLEWYESHQGTFWVYLSYDKYTNFKSDDYQYQNLSAYSQVVEVFFADFSYTVEKRGGSYDFWTISVSLEEV